MCIIKLKIKYSIKIDAISPFKTHSNVILVSQHTNLMQWRSSITHSIILTEVVRQDEPQPINVTISNMLDC